ncbi:NAD(P) transhydrogenase subunit alpha [Mycetocola sp. 2940]|uniref:NAD(P) transhydrogenase subunit alpha n=1 Tax=Mycetocola sp. 2940 TaxID=3156452 RepID=UPI003395F93C
MSSTVLVRAEPAAGEKRVAATPDSIRKLKAAGLEIQVEAGAGRFAGIDDASYRSAGAHVADGDRSPADVLFHVRPLSVSDVQALPAGTITVGTVDPFNNIDVLRALASAGHTSFALDFLPRISRAQSMDVLSSQALIAGYKCVLLAADAFDRIFPMTMTAAGTLAPARVLVLGAGVAGLQAIATSKRLGGVVSAYDVRSSSAEEVRSVGGTFISLDLEAADASGGYARELGEARAQRQRELLTPYVEAADIIITTAAVPGRPAPRLITSAMMAGMKAGSVVVDLAAETGGNVEASVPGERTRFSASAGDVTVIGVKDIHSELAVDSSKLLAMNFANFLTALTVDGVVVPDFSDEIVSGSCLTHDGAIVHPRITELLTEEVAR